MELIFKINNLTCLDILLNKKMQKWRNLNKLVDFRYTLETMELLSNESCFMDVIKEPKFGLIQWTFNRATFTSDGHLCRGR